MTLRLAMSLVVAVSVSVLFLAGAAVSVAAGARAEVARGSSVALARGGAAPVPSGLAIYERSTKTARWLEVRDLQGGSALALTPRPSAGEIRRDCCAIWSPAGTEVAFIRKTPKHFGVYLVNADGSHLHQLLSSAQLTPWIKQPIANLDGLAWSHDGSKLLLSVDVGRRPCTSDGVYRVNEDGSGLGPLWRRPPRLQATVGAFGWSPDGTRALFDLSHNDGDCIYIGGHVGPEELRVVADNGAGISTTFLKTSGVGAGVWSPDGSEIAYTADCLAGRGNGEACNLGLMRADGQHARLLTHYHTFTEPDSLELDYLPFLWRPDGKQLIVGRFRSLFAVDPASGRTQRLATAPCLRPAKARCSLNYIDLYGISSAGVVVFDVGSEGTLVGNEIHGSSTVELYAMALGDHRLVRLPLPSLGLDDLHLP